MYTALMTVIVMWLSANFDLPAYYNHPQLEFLPSEEIEFIYELHSKNLPENSTKTASHEVSVLDRHGNIVSIYDSSTRKLLLSDKWKGDTPAEASILVHEMVHHLQNASQKTYECPARQEELAYEAQRQWLKLFKKDLFVEFDLDEFTVKLLAMCSE